MRLAAFALLTFGLLATAGCDSTTTEPGDRTRNAVESDHPANSNSGTPASSDTSADATSPNITPDKAAGDADLPAGVQEKPADELPKVDSEGNENKQ